ncbi:PE-PGRS family protein [Variovorax sp. WDL1]|nr:PE-PGRS family protein [Variovorax sp. WDL1]
MAALKGEGIPAGLRGGGGAVECTDELDAVAASQRSKPAEIHHLDSCTAAGHGSRTAEDQPVARAGAVPQEGAKAQEAVAGRMRADDRESRARRVADEGDGPGIGEAGDALAEAGQVQRGTGGDAVSRGRTEGIGSAGAQGAFGHGGGTAIAVGTREDERAASDLAQVSRAGDGAGESAGEGAGIDDGIDGVGEGDRVAQGEAVGGKAQCGAFVHGEFASAQGTVVGHGNAALLQIGAARVAVRAGARERQHAGARLGQGARACDGAAHGQIDVGLQGPAASAEVDAARACKGIGGLQRCPVEGQRTRQRAEVLVCRDRQHAPCCRCAACVRVGPGKGEGAGAALDQRSAGPVDRPTHDGGQVVAAHGEFVGAEGVAACPFDRAGREPAIPSDPGARGKIDHTRRVVGDGRLASGTCAVEGQRGVVLDGSDGTGVGAGDLQVRVVEDRSRQRSAGLEPQRAGAVGGASRVAVGARQHQRAGAFLRHRAASRDRLADAKCRVGQDDVEAPSARSPLHGPRGGRERRAGDLQHAAVEGECARRCPEIGIARDRQLAARERGAAAVAIGARDGQGAGTALGESAGARDGIGKGVVARLLDQQRGVVGDSAAAEAGGAAGENAGTDCGSSQVAVGAREGQLAGAGLGQTATA